MRLGWQLLYLIPFIGIAGCGTTFNGELQAAHKSGRPLFVTDLRATKPNREGWTHVRIQLHNASHKVIKYVDFDVVGHNRVGDAVLRRDGGHEALRIRFTGPLNPRRSPGGVIARKVWRAGAVACVRVQKVAITHMDGTSVALEGAELGAVLAKRLQKPCPTVRGT